MFTIRSIGIVTIAGTCGLLSIALQSPDAHHDAQPATKMAADIFAQRCSTCHVAPDLAYATDRAWVDQVSETA